MREENKKEILTKKQIRYDIKYHSVKELMMVMVIPLLILFWILILKLLDSDLVASGAISSDKFGLAFIIVLLSLLFLIFLFVVFKCLNQLFSIKGDKYKIIKDRLVNTKGGVGPIPSKSITIYRPYRLYFSKNKRKYDIPHGKNYKWSKDFCMYEYNVFNSSTIGDEFYLILINDKRIAAVYNTKLFELQD